MLENYAEAMEVIGGVRALAEAAADGKIAIDSNVAWVIVAALAECSDWLEREYDLQLANR